MPVNSFLVRYNGGWAQRESGASIAAYGRTEATLGLGAIASLPEAYRICDEQFATFAEPRESIEAGMHPISDSEAPYVGFVPGDALPVPDSTDTSLARRVQAITVSEDNDTGRGIIGVTLRDVILAETERFSQATKKMTNGTLQGRSKVAQPVALGSQLRRVGSLGQIAAPPTPPAVAPVLMAAAKISGSADPIVTGSVTPTAGALQLLAIHAKNSGSVNPNVMVSVDGFGLTWVLVTSVLTDTGGVSRGRVMLYRAMGAAPTPGVVNMHPNVIDQGLFDFYIAYVLFELTGVDQSGTDGSGAVVQALTASGTSTAPSVTLAAFGSANNATVGVCGHAVSSIAGGAFVGSFAPGSGFTEIAEPGSGAITAAFCAVESRADNSLTVDGTIDSSDPWGMIGLEIARAT